MSFNNRVKINMNAKALTVLTGSAPQVGTGNTVLMNNVMPGTICAKIAMAVKTSSLTMTPSWQVSDDNSTWIDVKGLNNPAQVATAAGTGSTVTTTIQLIGDSALSSHRYARAIVTTAAATADGVADAFSVSYSWIQNEGL